MKTVAFLGDSVTQGCFEIGAPIDPASAYHSKLKQMIPDMIAINAGIGGDRAQDGLKRMQTDVLAQNPDLTVVCFGLNNIPAGRDGLDDYLQALEQIFLQLDPQKTVFMTPNMLNTYVHPQVDPQYAEFAKLTAQCQLDGTADRYMEKAVCLAKSMQVTVCDCYQQWKTLYRYGIDTTTLLANYINHPTRAMHTLFSEALYPIILKKIK